MLQKRSPTSPLGLIIFAGIMLGVGSWLLKHTFPPEKNLDAAWMATPVALATATANFLPIPTNPVSEESLSVSKQPGARVGSPAPDFELEDGEGVPTRLSELVGKIVVINFWASWCPPCRAEMPDLQFIFEKYADEDLIVLGVNTAYMDVHKDALAFVEELGLTFPILYDETGEVGEQLYFVRGLPTSYWIDRQGFVRSINIGAMTRDQMVAAAEELALP